MTPDQADNAVKAARAALTDIAEMRASTPDRVRVAYRLGIRKGEIHQLSGLSRSTIDRYLGHQP